MNIRGFVGGGGGGGEGVWWCRGIKRGIFCCFLGGEFGGVFFFFFVIGFCFLFYFGCWGRGFLFVLFCFLFVFFQLEKVCCVLFCFVLFFFFFFFSSCSSKEGKGLRNISRFYAFHKNRFFLFFAFFSFCFVFAFFCFFFLFCFFFRLFCRSPSLVPLSFSPPPPSKPLSNPSLSNPQKKNTNTTEKNLPNHFFIFKNQHKPQPPPPLLFPPISQGALEISLVQAGFYKVGLTGP